MTAPDQLLATAEIDGGAVLSVHPHDGEAALPRTRFEIAGTTGSLALVSLPEPNPWAAQLQIGRLVLHLSRPGDGQWRQVG